jgi:HTTM domain/Vitamin K-dependent gamma-carboxylase, lumenal domain
MSELAEILGTPITSTPVCLFRFLFGMTLFYFVFSKRQFLVDYYTLSKFYFKYPLFSWVKAPSKQSMKWIIYTLCVSSLLFSLGVAYTYSTLVTFILFTYIFLLDKAIYTNHHYLICLLLFLFLMIPGAHTYSIDAWISGHFFGNSPIPYGNLLIIQIQLLVMYTWGGINKINFDWMIRAQPLRQRLRSRAECYTGIVRKLFKQKWFAYVMSWGGMFFDLSIIWLFLFVPDYFLLWTMVFLIFHLFNQWFFKIGIFPYMNYASLILFYPFEVVPESYRTIPVGSFELFFFVAFVSIQALIPSIRFLHFALIAGPARDLMYDAYWNFSWTMKLKHTTAFIEFTVFDRVSKEKILKFIPQEILLPRLYQYLSKYPSNVLQYVTHLRRSYELDQKNYGIKAKNIANINDRGEVTVIDETIDLTKEKQKNVGTYSWIINQPLSNGSSKKKN